MAHYCNTLGPCDCGPQPDPKPSAREVAERWLVNRLRRKLPYVEVTLPLMDTESLAAEIDAYADAKLEEAAGLVENMRGGDITTYGQIAAAIRALKGAR